MVEATDVSRIPSEILGIINMESGKRDQAGIEVKKLLLQHLGNVSPVLQKFRVSNYPETYVEGLIIWEAKARNQYRRVLLLQDGAYDVPSSMEELLADEIRHWQVRDEVEPAAYLDIAQAAIRTIESAATKQ